MPRPCAPIQAHSTRGHRFHLLDGLRGILALLVVVRHAPTSLTFTGQNKDVFLAVDFFFCLSGFVTAFAYEERLGSRIRFGDFAAARLIRLYPMYLLATIIAFFFALGPGHLLSEPGGRTLALCALPSLFFLPSIPLLPGSSLYPLNMPAWTMLVEIGMNLVYALLLRMRRGSQWMLATLCVVCWCTLALVPGDLDSGSTWPGAFIGFARIGFSFPAGTFVFLLWKKLPLGGLRRTRGLPSGLGILALLLAIIIIPTPFSGHRAYQLLILTIGLPGLIFFGADVQLGGAWSKWCAVLGSLSYPLYIVHLPLLEPLYGSHVVHFTQLFNPLARVLLPLYVVLLAGIAWALQTYLDRPLRRWLVRRYNRQPLPVSPVPSLPIGGLVSN